MTSQRGSVFMTISIYLIFRCLHKGIAELFSKDLLNKFRHMAEKKEGL